MNSEISHLDIKVKYVNIMEYTNSSTAYFDLFRVFSYILFIRILRNPYNTQDGIWIVYIDHPLFVESIQGMLGLIKKIEWGIKKAKYKKENGHISEQRRKKRSEYLNSILGNVEPGDLLIELTKKEKSMYKHIQARLDEYCENYYPNLKMFRPKKKVIAKG